MDDRGPVFLSYHRPDFESVRVLRERMRAEGIPAFLDQENLRLGQSWPDALERGLTSCRAVLVFVGADGLGPWQRKEVWFALDLQVSSGIPVIPVLLPGSRTTTGFLSQNTWVDLRERENEEEQVRRLLDALGGAPQTRLDDAGATSIDCPYLGLRAFQEEDAGLFFGRDAFIERLLEQTLREPLIAVVGASGSGKSSVVRAGLLPRLRRQRRPNQTWEIAIHTPTSDPFATLAGAVAPLLEPDAKVIARLETASRLKRLWREDPSALGLTLVEVLKQQRGTDRLLLVIDQFEELFTMTPAEERIAFLDVLFRALATRKVTLLVTLRADYYGHAIEARRELGDAMARAQVNVGPLTKDELRDVIEEPAKRAGLKLQDGLADRILADMDKQANALPLLEYALESLWERRQQSLITHDAYDELGELSGVITRRAEETFAKLSTEEQAAAEELFLRLVHVADAGGEGADTRHRARRSELSSKAWSVAQAFADKPRLLTIARASETTTSGVQDDLVDVVHEALIRHWDRLLAWVNQRRDFLTWRQGLQGALKVWEANERAPGALLSEIPLQEALGWRRRQRANLSARELAFIEESQRATRRRGRRTLVMLGLVAGIAAAFVSLTRTGRYEVERMMMTPPYAPEPLSAGSMYAAAGMLGWSGSVALLAPESAQLPQAEWLPQAKDLVSRAVLRLSRGSDEQTPRQMLLGLLAAGRFADAEARVQAESSPGRRICAHSALSVGFSALGMDHDAARHVEMSRQRLDDLDEEYLRGNATICVLEATIWRGDREAATDVMERLQGSPGMVHNVGSILYALAYQGWFPDFRSMLRAYVDMGVGATLGLRAYARKGSEEDVSRLGEKSRQDGVEYFRLAWLIALLFEERLDPLLAEVGHAQSDYFLLNSAMQLAMRLHGKDGCREARTAFKEDAMGGLRCEEIWPSGDTQRHSTVFASYEIPLVAEALGVAGDIERWQQLSQAATESERTYWRQGLVQGLSVGGRADLAASEALDQLTKDWAERPRLLAVIAQGARASEDPGKYYSPLFEDSRSKDFFFQQLRALADPEVARWTTSSEGRWVTRERAVERAAQQLTDVFRYALSTDPERAEYWLNETLHWAANSEPNSPHVALTVCRSLSQIGEYARARQVADGLREPADRRLAYASIIATYARNTNPEIDRRLATPLGDLILLPD